MRCGPRAFSRVSTGDSHNPSTCEMNDEPAFKPLQGNLAFFRLRGSQRPFHLRQQTQAPSHTHIAERSLLLRCWWKVRIPLDLKRQNQLSSRDDLGYTELSSSCCAELGVPLDLGRCSPGISGVAERKSSHLCLMGNMGWLWRKGRGIGPHLELICGTRSSFVFLR